MIPSKAYLKVCWKESRTALFLMRFLSGIWVKYIEFSVRALFFAVQSSKVSKHCATWRFSICFSLFVSLSELCPILEKLSIELKTLEHLYIDCCFSSLYAPYPAVLVLQISSTTIASNWLSLRSCISDNTVFLGLYFLVLWSQKCC